MATLLIEMPSGVAGDMLLAALVDLGGDLERAQRDLLALGLGPIRIAQARVSVNGISAIQVDVEAEQEARWAMGDQGDQHPAKRHPRHDDEQRHGRPHHHSHQHGHSHDHDQPHGHGHSHPLAPPHATDSPSAHAGGIPNVSLSHHAPHAHHRPYHVIRDLIAAAALPAPVKVRAQAVFLLLAEAEGQVHGVSAEQVEFHEVGAIDAIADVVGCCLLLDYLGITRIVATPIVPGTGSVMCAHGRMPVPVPAVAAMLARRGAPWRQLADETGELTTPTGCALVTALADAYLHPGTSQVITSSTVGYGAGHRRIPGMTNVLRVSVIDESEEAAQGLTDHVAELICTVDDATGEYLAVLIEDLLLAGARDAYLAPVIMKKGRPGHQLTVLTDPDDMKRIAALILMRSPTIGVRHRLMERTVLPRRSASVLVDGQAIMLKIVTLPDGSERAKPEADSVRSAARILGRDFVTMHQQALAVYLTGGPSEDQVPPGTR